MCGIAGELRFDRVPDPNAVRRMTDALAHRGPDAEGFFADGPVALGHRRLSILDIEGGAQPMTREGCTLVFNGQAYEHQALRRILLERGHSFSTRSDTEVVLRAYLEWGESFVERIQGMFAIGLWDGNQRKLILARDRMGKKPLYYALGDSGQWTLDPSFFDGTIAACRLTFGSELKALRARADVPNRLDREAFLQYLAVEYVPAPLSIYACVRKLPAAHLAVLDQHGFRMRRYWELPAPSPRSSQATPAENESELLRLLDQAVARRLVADVPVGVFLSGGVDSTAVAALAVRHRRPLETFSVGFSESSFDESPFSQLAARQLGTDHHAQQLTGDACLEQLPEAVAQLDEPLADPSILPTLLLSRFARKRVTVALTGDGGDELFAGYDTFLAHRPAELLAHLPQNVRLAMQHAVDRLPASEKNMSLDFRLKQFLRGLSTSASLRHQRWIGSLGPEEMKGLVHPDLRPMATEGVLYREVLAEAERSLRAGVQPESIDGALRFYLGRYLADDILVKADRASMAASLEVRSPFLDTHLVEFAARLPWEEKLGLKQTKRILKRALREVVPEEILHRPKKGFGIPVASWIRGPLRPLFEDLFSIASLTSSGVFEAGAVRQLLDRHLLGGADLRKPLWTIAMFLLWQRKWG